MLNKIVVCGKYRNFVHDLDKLWLVIFNYVWLRNLKRVCCSLDVSPFTK